MGRKRNAAGVPFGRKNTDDVENDQESKLLINSYKDVADSEDEFLLNRDELLLDEGPEAKRRRKVKENEEFLEQSDEEILGYDSDEASENDDLGSEDEDLVTKSKPSKRSRGQMLESESDDNESAEDEEEIGGWGAEKQNYYNADEIETEAQALEEEEEAKRLQKKHLEKLTEADFGFDEDNWMDTSMADDEQINNEAKIVIEKLPQVKITPEMSEDERQKLLRSRYPEFEPLAKEFLALKPLYEDLCSAATAAETAAKRQSPGLSEIEADPPIAVIKCRTLSAYLGVLSMYFALLTSTATEASDTITAMPVAELHDHVVMTSLLRWKGLWDKIKDVPIPDPSNLSKSTDEAVTVKNGPLGQLVVMEEKPVKLQSKPKAHTKKSKAERLAAAARLLAEEQRSAILRKTDADLANLSNLVNSSKSVSSKSRNRHTPNPAVETADSDFGSETELTPHEAALKAAKKKSLRFYTSQIVQKSNKRSMAGRDAGGDMDIPHRERLRDRQARLNEEAERRGKKNAEKGTELGGPSDEEDDRTAKEIRQREEGDYYDMVVAHARSKEAKKARAAHKNEQVEPRKSNYQEETVGPDGKRRVTYQIEKNKGLAPKRKKDVRNPRVKKRHKYEEKMKKLKTIRPVWRGGEGKGGYGGELTGIKTGLVKSIKF